jgi:hypothetical protein
MASESSQLALPKSRLTLLIRLMSGKTVVDRTEMVGSHLLGSRRERTARRGITRAQSKTSLVSPNLDDVDGGVHKERPSATSVTC